MKTKICALLAVGILLIAQTSCNLPTSKAPAPAATKLPAPNQTLTALFSITPPSLATPTLPPVVTSTTAADAGANPAVPTNTRAPVPSATNKPPSANPTATNTQPPPPTATIPSTRPRAAVVAKFLTTPPTIDGDWTEWKDITKEYPANAVVWGQNNWTGADDLSSSFHIGWDNNNLYIAVKVRDEKYVQNASGANIYKGDSIELLLDTMLRDDFYYQQLSPDDYQLGISPGRPDPKGTREAYLWFPSSLAGSRNNITIGSILENGVYRVEAAIPWSVFGLTPVNGMHYGFCMSVNDNDDPNNNVQQSMVSNVSTRHLTDPTTWGDMQLVK